MSKLTLDQLDSEATEPNVYRFTMIQRGSKSSRFRLMDVLGTNPNPLEYAMFPWLPIQGIAFIYAATGVGKTLFTLNVAYAIGSGGDFLNINALNRAGFVCGWRNVIHPDSRSPHGYCTPAGYV